MNKKERALYKEMAKVLSKRAETDKDPLKERAKLKSKIDECTVNGKIPLLIWERDCDLYEVERVQWCNANVTSFEATLTNLEQWQEGPFTVRIITKQYADNHTTWTRDRAAEMMNY